MKIKFDPSQAHQRRGWEAACGVFEGQELNKTVFSMPSIKPVGGLDEIMTSNQTDKGYGNRLKILDEEILENVKENKIDSIPYLITNMYDEIIINMINVDREKRYNIYDINLS